MTIPKEKPTKIYGTKNIKPLQTKNTYVPATAVAGDWMLMLLKQCHRQP